MSACSLAKTIGTISSTKTSTLNSNPNSASTEKTTVAKTKSALLTDLRLKPTTMMTTTSTTRTMTPTKKKKMRRTTTQAKGNQLAVAPPDREQALALPMK